MNHFIALNDLNMQEAMKNAWLGSVQTENLTVAYTDMKAGVEIPMHQHPEEAVDIMLEGKLEMQVGEVSSILIAGMISIVPSSIPHRARAISDCRVLTVFYPKRGM